MAKSRKSTHRTSSKRRAPKSKSTSTSAPAPKTRQATAPTSVAVNGSDSAAAAPARSSKKALIVALLQRPDGAAIGDLIAATGWQVHSVRAALTGLRKEGKDLVRSKGDGGITHYRLAAGA